MKKVFFLLFIPLSYLVTACQKNNSENAAPKQFRATVLDKAWNCSITLIRFDSDIDEIEAIAGESGSAYGTDVYGGFNLPDSLNEKNATIIATIRKPRYKEGVFCFANVIPPPVVTIVSAKKY